MRHILSLFYKGNLEVQMLTLRCPQNLLSIHPRLKVVVYLGLFLLTCVKSPSACEFQYSSISSWFEENLNNVRHVLFNDYEVPVVSNFELDNHCLVLWRIIDTYTVLEALPDKAESELKGRIKKLLKDLSFLQGCSFLVPETCIKHKRPLVQVLKELNSQQLESIIKDYSNCTAMRCALGESSNKTALHQDFEYHTPQITRNRYLIVVVVVVLGVFLTHFVLKKKLCGEDHNKEAEVVRTSAADPEAQNGDQ